MTRGWSRVSAAALMGLVSFQAGAVDFETLLMPGELGRAHAEFESDCSKCHTPLRRTAQKPLCLTCHEQVDADLASGVGFHGRAGAVQRSECRTCHPDHRGRTADVLGLDPETFDHEVTDFALEGSHRLVLCNGCHVPDKTYRDAPSDCVSCHRDDEPHRGRLGTVCADCHSPLGWSDTRFDHSKTDFPLVGGHRSVDCAHCHPSERYENTPGDCYACHRLDDSHRGRLGSDCGECHSPRGWKKTGFDHDRETRFRLTGAHRNATCNQCHSEDPHHEKPRTDCYSCHKLDDDHRGANGVECERCHGSSAWTRPTFDHDRDTRFPLRGSHASLVCTRCHNDAPYEEKRDTRCYACHRADDVHEGQEGTRCERCHNEGAWGDDVFFDHEITRFPLLGLHAVAACEACHMSATFQDADTGCWSCHATDDSHEHRFGESCQLCHNPNGWKLWDFDHGRQTDFPLHGAHEDLDCHACHSRSLESHVRRGSGCHACHAADDVHRGGFGRDCARCHSETSWDGADLAD
jgi:hypothetical protein